MVVIYVMRRQQNACLSDTFASGFIIHNKISVKASCKLHVRCDFALQGVRARADSEALTARVRLFNVLASLAHTHLRASRMRAVKTAAAKRLSPFSQRSRAV